MASGVRQRCERLLRRCWAALRALDKEQCEACGTFKLLTLRKLRQQTCPWDRLCDHTKAPRRPEGDVTPNRCLLVSYSELAALPCQHIG